MHVDRLLAVGIDRDRHAPDEIGLEVRVLSAENGVPPDDVPLPLEGLEVVGDRHQVGLGRKPIGGVAPVGVVEGAELARLHEGPHPILHPFEVGRARERPLRDRLRQGGGLRRIGGERRDDVHPVEGVQVVEVDHVVLHLLESPDHGADELGVLRHLDPEGVLDGAHRGDGVHRGADAADPLSEDPGVPRVAALEDDLDSPEHGAGRPGVLNPAGIDLGLDPEMAFDSGDRVDDDSSHGGPPQDFFFGSSDASLLSARCLWMDFTIPWAVKAAAVPATSPTPIASALTSTPKPSTLGSLS